MLEFLLGLLALHELEIVDQQNVDGAKLVLERNGVLAAHGFHELVAEAFGRQVEHLRFGRPPFDVPGDGVQEMRLAQPDRGMEVQGIEGALLVKDGGSHLRRHGMRNAVGLPLHEALERVLGIERGSFKAVHGGAEECRTRSDGHAARPSRGRFRRSRVSCCEPGRRPLPLPRGHCSRRIPG